MIATIIPIRTNTTIATCIQIHVGDISAQQPTQSGVHARRGAVDAASIVLRMHSRPHATLLGLVLALCALCVLASSGAARDGGAATTASSTTLIAGVNIPAVGYAPNLAEADRAIAAAAALHVKAVRVEVPWAAFEPRDAEHLNLRAQGYADRLASDAAAARIRLIMTVESTPCWASSAPVSLLRACSSTRPSRANTWPPTRAGDYAAFTAYLAARYGPAIAAIEIWNEPDQANEAYFAGPSKARRYAEVLRAAYPAIKHVNPRIVVLGGSLVGSNGAFLRALYAAGIKRYYDGLAVHFYNLTLASLRSIHEAQLAGGDATPLWLDEFGWTSCWPRRRVQQEQGCVTSHIQAVNLSDTVRALARTPYVAAAVVYKLQDSDAEDFGLLSAPGAHKPAFVALARLLPTIGGHISRVTLGLNRSGASVVAAGSGPVGDFMLLEAFQGAVLRYRAVFTLDRFNRYSIVLPSVLGTHGLRVRVYQYGPGPGVGAEKTI